MSTTHNPDIRRVNGKLQMSQDQKNHVVFSRKRKRCSWFSWITTVLYIEFLLEGQTVNKEYYLGVMRRLREAVCQKRKDLWANNSWILHHDNAPSHSAIIIREFLTKNETNTI